MALTLQYTVPAGWSQRHEIIEMALRLGNLNAQAVSETTLNEWFDMALTALRINDSPAYAPHFAHWIASALVRFESGRERLQFTYEARP